ncbi:hypothetical protein BDFB_010821, partial [Asbolus verrucosus]
MLFQHKKLNRYVSSYVLEVISLGFDKTHPKTMLSAFDTDAQVICDSSVLCHRVILKSNRKNKWGCEESIACFRLPYTQVYSRKSLFNNYSTTVLHNICIEYNLDVENLQEHPLNDDFTCQEPQNPNYEQ